MTEKTTVPAGSLAVKPAADLVVRVPERGMRPLRVEGELVPATDYWRRRIAARDVAEIPDADWGEAEDDRIAKAKAAEDKAADEAKKAAATKPAAPVAKPA